MINSLGIKAKNGLLMMKPKDSKRSDAPEWARKLFKKIASNDSS